MYKGQPNKKAPYPEIIDKILSGVGEPYVYLDMVSASIVVFMMPPHLEVERLYNMSEFGVIKATDVEDYIWSKYVIGCISDQTDPILKDNIKVGLVGAIALSTIMQRSDDIIFVTQFADRTVSYSEIIKKYLIGADGDLTFERLDKLTVVELIKLFSHKLQTHKSSINEFVKNLKKYENGGVTITPNSDASTVAEVLKQDVRALEQQNKEVQTAAVFRTADNIEQARQMTEFTNVFKKLDYISKSGMTQQEIDIKMNPTGDIDTETSVVGGKIIDRDTHIPKHKIKFKRNIGS